MSDDILKGPRKQEVRILEKKPHLCTTIGGIIVKDLGEYNTNTKRLCGEPVYTAKQLEDMYQPSIEERIKDGLDREEGRRLAIMKDKEEKRKQKEFEDKIRRETEELELRAKQAVVKKMERQYANDNANIDQLRDLRRRIGDEDVSKLPSLNDSKVIDKVVDNKRLTTAVDTSKVVNEVEKKIEIPKMPIPDINITATTNTGTSSMSGTATITPDIKFIVPIPKIDTGIGVDKLKVEIEKRIEKKVEDNRIKDDNKTEKRVEVKEEADPYDWYINETLRLKK